jgi:uncharacterized protein (TIGR02757 family)
MQQLESSLNQLISDRGGAAEISNDPVSLAHRYSSSVDVEIAGLIASQLAYGRVSLFLPILNRIFDHADERGGPEAWLRGFRPEEEITVLDSFGYRFSKGLDHAIFFETIGRIIRRYGSLKSLFEQSWVSEGSMRGTLLLGVGEMRIVAAKVGVDLGVGDGSFRSLPRGAKHCLTSPESGSACKRWNLFMRWMVRPADGVDLGLWGAIPASSLIIPLDVHVHRISKMLGITNRATPDWRTAQQITSALAVMSPKDPIKYDFALAHIGISGGCSGEFVPSTCNGCLMKMSCVKFAEASVT